MASPMRSGEDSLELAPGPAGAVAVDGQVSPDPYQQVVAVQGDTLGTSAFEVLRESIISGRLFSGQRLVEATLAQELGISRGPLREALALLERDGLVEAVPRRGHFVLRFTERAVEEFYQVRRLLEAQAVELLISSLTPAKLERLQLAAEEVRSAEQTASMAELVRQDLEFHGLLYQLSEQQLLERMWRENFVSKLHLLVHVTVPAHYQPLSQASNHDRIVQAIAERDIPLAKRLVGEHIDDAVARARRAIAAQERPEEGCS